MLLYCMLTAPVAGSSNCDGHLTHIQVNGEDMKYSTHLQAMQAIWNSGPCIKLCIRRKMSAINDGNFSFSESMSFLYNHCRALIRIPFTVYSGLHSPCMEVEVIELVKPEKSGLGLIIGSREYVWSLLCD